MQVRIFFRGLILFQFPGDGTLVAELISEPAGRKVKGKAVQGQDDHESQIQVITGEDVRQLLPHRLERLKGPARVDIKIPECAGNVKRANNFDACVPNIHELAKMANLPPNALKPADRDSYVRAVVTVNCGTLRVKEVVMWDASGYPLPKTKASDRPTTPAEVRFCGTPIVGHAANECVLEVPETDIVDISSPDFPQLDGIYRSTRRRNQLAQASTTDILVHNYEYQRDRPVPWGLDFQWLAARLGYGEADLAAAIDAFEGAVRADPYADLLEQDLDSLLPNRPKGRPFPYIESPKSLTTLAGLRNEKDKRTPLTDIESRPVCVPGRGG